MALWSLDGDPTLGSGHLAANVACLVGCLHPYPQGAGIS